MMRLPLVQFRDMLEQDDTRPSEWFSGLATLAMGYWVWHFYVPPSDATHRVMFKFVGPVVVAIGFMVAGALQVATAGQVRILWFRKLLGTLIGAAWVYTLVAYWTTHRESLVTALLPVFILKMAWVTWRIERDNDHAS